MRINRKTIKKAEKSNSSSSRRAHVAPQTLKSGQCLSQQVTSLATKNATKVEKDVFLKYIKETFGKTSLEELSDDEEVSESLLGKYIVWILQEYKTKENKCLKCGSVLQYLAAARNALQNAKKHHKIFETPNPEWYTVLRQSVMTYMTREAICNGEALVDKADPVGRVLISKICEHFSKSSDINAATKRIAIIANRLACGRSGELANCTWRLAKWDSENGCLVWTWPEQKTNRHKIVPNPPDYENYYCDFYHAMGEYFMAKTSSNNTTTNNGGGECWVFNNLFDVVNVSQVSAFAVF